MHNELDRRSSREADLQSQVSSLQAEIQLLRSSRSDEASLLAQLQSQFDQMKVAMNKLMADMRKQSMKSLGKARATCVPSLCNKVTLSDTVGAETRTTPRQQWLQAKLPTVRQVRFLKHLNLSSANALGIQMIVTPPTKWDLSPSAYQHRITLPSGPSDPPRRSSSFLARILILPQGHPQMPARTRSRKAMIALHHPCQDLLQLPSRFSAAQKNPPSPILILPLRRPI